MKKWITLMFSVLMIFSLTACSAQVDEQKQMAENTQTEKTVQNINKEEGSSEMMNRKIKVTGQNGEIIVFALNGS